MEAALVHARRPARAARETARRPVAVVVAPDGATVGWIEAALETLGLNVSQARTASELLDVVRRARPALVVLDAGALGLEGVGLTLLALKAHAYTAVVPCIVRVDRAEHALAMLQAGADDVLVEGDEATGAARIATAVRRSVRDLSAQPTTRLPAAVAIQDEITRRIANHEPFAACYADLDHFKEYNDRYGFHEGDRIIRMTARVLYDAAVGVAGGSAFVGHVGGDDFMLVLPIEAWSTVCDLALDVFDTLVPFQYSEADRRAGYYFGKDRRGHLHRVPLMTLSIGVATTERRRFRSAAVVSRLASEMKSFAKAKPGSVYAVDRRSDDDDPPPTPSAQPRDPSSEPL